MTTKRNAAQRLLKIAKKTQEHPTTSSVKDVWAAIFNLGDMRESKKEHEIATNLRLLTGQVEAVTDYAENEGIPADLYTQATAKLHRGFSLAHITGAWSTTMNHFDAQTQLSLGWLAHVMPDEPSQVADSLRDEIENTLEKLNELLSDNDAPPSLKTFVREQVEIIKKGLQQSDIIGPTALSDALYEGYKNAHKNEEVVEEHSESPALRGLATAWRVVKKVPGAVIHTNKALGAASGLAEKGQKAIEFFNTFS